MHSQRQQEKNKRDIKNIERLVKTLLLFATDVTLTRVSSGTFNIQSNLVSRGSLVISHREISSSKVVILSNVIFAWRRSFSQGHFYCLLFFFSRYGFFTLPDSAHPTVCAYLLVSCDLGLPFASCETMPGYETSHFTPRAPMMFTFVKAPKAVKLASHEPMLTLAVTTLPLSLVLGWAKL